MDVMIQTEQARCSFLDHFKCTFGPFVEVRKGGFWNCFPYMGCELDTNKMPVGSTHLESKSATTLFFLQE